MGTKVNTSYGTKLKYNWPLTFINTLLVCLIHINMLNFVVTMCTVKCCNRFILINTFVYAVGTKINNSYGIKLKFNQPLACTNLLLRCGTGCRMFNFVVSMCIV